MIWLLSAFRPNVLISIQAWLLLKAPWHTLGASLSTDVPKCLIGYHWCLWLLASHEVGSLQGSQPRECVADSCTVTWDPASHSVPEHMALMLMLHELHWKWNIATGYHEGASWSSPDGLFTLHEAGPGQGTGTAQEEAICQIPVPVSVQCEQYSI